ncbi:T9SS C-terminal target domain-containing protein [Paraflavitalea soli]|uniref:T9SS C-terminal target domain-containing protein n=1 Tax=Paraflavitalea soli TaxID=2315862 RepID=A0A3B7MER5_9BACT|nr:cellulose binding domain-containing protein [Paraflavitalea soli]AXY72824.1 T9SS C-terminal target domain-containing protein [Paraflavitalea soli]
MKKNLSMLTALAMGLLSTQVYAQQPNLPAKASLNQSLLVNKTFSNPTQTDTITTWKDLPASYTLEVVAKVNDATGRGLDIEARNGAMKGWRLSLDPLNLKTSSTLTSAKAITLSRSGEEHTIRVAVKGDSAYIYQNGAYIETQPLAAIKDIANGIEVNNPPNSGSPSLVSNWAGTAPNNTGKPSDYGWGYNGTTVTNLFNVANGTSGVRYTDVNATVNTHTLDGATYNARLLFLRWDGSTTQNTVFYYPVTLEANTNYDFSMLHAYFSNSTGGRSMTVGVGKTTAVTDRLAAHTFATTGTRVLKRENFAFTSQEAGTYYLTITGDWALFTVGELALRKFYAEPRFIFGKNYPAGAVNMEIASVTYEEGAYAPASIITGATQTVNVAGATASYLTSFNTQYVVSGKTDLHLTGNWTPFVNSTVELNSNDAWLFIDNVKPSQVVANWLNKITINGLPAAGNPNVRIAIYKNGTAIIPNGNLTAAQALEAFTAPGLTGNSRTFETATYHDSLGIFDNNIRSFRLRRGFLATLANNPDGTGYSRVFIANDSDLVINTMPEGLDTSVSFIRVHKWDWPSKKGWAGGGLPVSLTNATWFYDWNIGGIPTNDYNYALIRHNAGWPAFNDINAKTNSNTLLGFNEPDQADQANMPVDEAIRQWPELMKSGLRIGSPAPANSSNSWLPTFLSKCDSLNYRVDFVAVHCYWNSRTPQQWYSGLKAIYDQVKRPLWITEWNNGANWTGEAWPTDPTAQFEKQYNDLKGILEVLDTTSFVERYSIYNWVENKRAMVLADTLTKAGKYYAANRSAIAYDPRQAFTHNWKLAVPIITGAIDTANYSRLTLRYLEVNGELGSKYIIERKVDGVDTAFVAIHTDSAYIYGKDISFVDSIYASTTYRIKAYSRNGAKSAYSGQYRVLRDATPLPPSSLTGEVLASSQVKLTWNAGTNVRSYNLKRALSADGPFETILGKTTQLTWQDTILAPATTYYYVVTTLNGAGESVNSTVLPLTTKALVTPAGVKNPRIAAGDNRITLSWDFIYDARYEIQRADAASGPYIVIAPAINAIIYADTTAINDHTYYYKVVPYNPAGRGPEAGPLSATPVFGQHLHITFNEGTGPLAEDTWGAYHGTLKDGAAWTAGKDSATGAVGLNVAARSYVQLPEGVVSRLNDFTIATWFKLPANQGNNTRLFDFGNDEATFMVLVPRLNNNQVRYKITCPAGTFQRDISYTTPLNQWVHMAISQKGNVFKLYVNGQLQYTDSNAVVKPSAMGFTRDNYLGRSQWPNDPYSDHQYDDFRIYNYGLTDAEVNQLANNTELKKYQLITFTPISHKRIGDVDAVATAAASSGLPLSFSSADTSVATIDQQGNLQINGAGTVQLTALQAGNEAYNPASATQTLIVFPYNLRTEHLNANGTNATGNSIRPYLTIVNDDSIALAWKELTARYWLTAENYTGINTWIDYAVLGNKVKAKYQSLPVPRNGALGYIAYSFDSTAGALLAGANSGVIQSRAANVNWGSFNENDDYSHTTNATYVTNPHITLYRNGKLIAGTEPAAVAEQLQLTVASQSRQSGANTISTVIQLSNTGNMPVNYEDLTIRYWFTAEGNATLTNWIDYAPAGTATITGAFTRLPQPRNGADAYLEFSFKPTLGVFYPLCNTGGIQYRIAKSDWSAFDQYNDHSNNLSAALAQNERITIYYKGQLIAGIEPSEALLTSNNTATGIVGKEHSTTGTLSAALLYPNPVQDNLNIRLDQVASNAIVKVYNASGIIVATATMNATTRIISLKRLPAGMYQVVINNGTEVISKKIIKE